MSIQIFGTKKCKETAKVIRYMKERRINFQFIDLAVKGMSKGELRKAASVLGLKNLIDEEGKQYEKRNLKYIVHNIEQELLEDPLLLKTPVVRNGQKFVLGFDENSIKTEIVSK